MARVPEYQQGPLASRRTPVVEDHSGEIMVNAGLRNSQEVNSALNSAYQQNLQGAGQLASVAGNAISSVFGAAANQRQDEAQRLAKKQQAVVDAKAREKANLDSDLLANNAGQDLFRQMDDYTRQAQKLSPTDAVGFLKNGGKDPSGKDVPSIEALMNTAFDSPALAGDDKALARVKMAASTRLTGIYKTLGDADSLAQTHQTVAETVDTSSKIGKFSGVSAPVGVDPLSTRALGITMGQLQMQQGPLIAAVGESGMRKQSLQDHVNAAMNWAKANIDNGSEAALKRVDSVFQLHGDHPGMRGPAGLFEDMDILDADQIKAIRTAVQDKREVNQKVVDNNEQRGVLDFKNQTQFTTYTELNKPDNNIGQLKLKQNLTQQLADLNKQPTSKQNNEKMTQLYQSLGDLNTALGQQATKEEAEQAKALGVNLESVNLGLKAKVTSERGDLDALEANHSDLQKRLDAQREENRLRPTKENNTKLEGLIQATDKSREAISNAKLGIEKKEHVARAEQKAAEEKAKEAAKAAEKADYEKNAPGALSEVSKNNLQLKITDKNNPSYLEPGSPEEVKVLHKYHDAIQFAGSKGYLKGEALANHLGYKNLRVEQSKKATSGGFFGKTNEQQTLETLTDKAPQIIHQVTGTTPTDEHKLDANFQSALTQSYTNAMLNVKNKDGHQKYHSVNDIPQSVKDAIKAELTVRFMTGGK